MNSVITFNPITVSVVAAMIPHGIRKKTAIATDRKRPETGNCKGQKVTKKTLSMSIEPPTPRYQLIRCSGFELTSERELTCGEQVDNCVLAIRHAHQEVLGEI